MSSIPRKHGYKLAYDYVRVVELLRVPEKLRQALEPGVSWCLRAPHSNAHNTVGSSS